MFIANGIENIGNPILDSNPSITENIDNNAKYMRVSIQGRSARRTKNNANGTKHIIISILGTRSQTTVKHNKWHRQVRNCNIGEGCQNDDSTNLFAVILTYGLGSKP